MKTTTSFIVIKDVDLGQLIPAPFCRADGYYVMANEEETMQPITWQALLDNYHQEHGGPMAFTVNETPVHLMKWELSPCKGDYSYTAAFAYGQGMTAPFGLVMNYKEAKSFIEQYQNEEE